MILIYSLSRFINKQRQQAWIFIASQTFLVALMTLITSCHSADTEMNLASVEEFLCDSLGIIPSRGECCEFTSKLVGHSSKQISIYEFEYDVGVSCRGVFRTVFFKQDHYAGYINSDIARPVELLQDTLWWQSERGDRFPMDLSQGIPKSMDFGGFYRTLESQ